MPSAEGKRVAIVTAEWNRHITAALRDGAVDTLRSAGVADDDIELFDVPGAVELTFAASNLIEASRFDAGLWSGLPHGGGEQQAIDRAGGVLGNKGCEAAEAAVKMMAFVDKVNEG